MAASSICLKCKDKTCLKSGTPCKEVEKILKKETTGRRNWQTSYNPAWFANYSSENLVIIYSKDVCRKCSKKNNCREICARKRKQAAAIVSTGKMKKTISY